MIAQTPWMHPAGGESAEASADAASPDVHTGAAPGEASTGSARVDGSYAPARGSNVIFVLNHLRLGGSEIKTVSLANELVRQGFQVGVACLNEPLDLAERLQADVRLWTLRRRGKFSSRTVRRLRTLAQQQRPAAMLAVNLYPSLYVLAATRGLQERPRTIGLVNTMMNGVPADWRHGLYRHVLSHLDWTVYGCELQRAGWARGSARMAERSGVIYNGVQLDSGPSASASDAGRLLRARLRIPPEAFVVGSVGRLAPEKNQSVLIDAAAHLQRAHREVHVVLVGEGGSRAALERRAKEQGVAQHVHFTGMLRDIAPALALMDVFVLPSRHETFSNAALEAMAMRLPVILSRVGGAAEMLRESIDGYLIDLEALAGSLPRLLARLQDDPGLRARLGAAARKRVEAVFSMERMVDAYRALIEHPVANEHAGGTA